MNSAVPTQGPVSTYSDHLTAPVSVRARAGEPAPWWVLLPCCIGVVIGLSGCGVALWNGNGHAAGWAINSAWWAGTAAWVSWRGRA